MKRNICHTFLLATAAWLLASCGEDRTYEFLAKTEVDNWIEDQMQEVYLYYQDMPQLEQERYIVFCPLLFRHGTRIIDLIQGLPYRDRSLNILQTDVLVRDTCIIYMNFLNPYRFCNLSFLVCICRKDLLFRL